MAAVWVAALLLACGQGAGAAGPPAATGAAQATVAPEVAPTAPAVAAAPASAAPAVASAAPAVASAAPTTAHTAPAVASAAPTTAPGERTWPDEAIYFIFLDRFRNGEPANDLNTDPADPRGWHGGDLQGVIEKLDYIKSLGFTAIWITPHVKNAGSDYHGYGAVDFFAADPHFGTVDQVRALVAAAHAREMKVIFDIVVNHTGPLHPLVTERPDWFHPRAPIIDWNDEAQVQNGWLFDLPDLDQQNPAVREYILSYSRFWIEQTGVDGFRLDTVKHVDPAFFTWYAAELQRVKHGFWLIGEVWEPWPERLATYQQAGVTALLDFPVAEAARNAFARDGSMTRLAAAVDDEATVMPDPYQMGAFLDNHDMPRFVTFAPDDPIRRLKLGLTFLFTQRSIPILYYGTEVALPGGDDPANRADFPWGQEEQSELRSLITRLNALRQERVALRRGTVQTLLADFSTYAYARTYGDDRVVVVLNNDAASAFSGEIDVSALGIRDGAILQDVLTGRSAPVTAGRFRPEVAPRSGGIYVVASAPTQQRTLAGWGLLVLLAGLATLGGMAVAVARRRGRQPG